MAERDMERTIAAIATPQAMGGVGMVRISGREARKIAARVFTPAREKKLSEIPGYTALYGRVHDKNGEIDEAIALNFQAPASFTGEDVVELSCHGGLYLMRRVLNAVIEAGASPAAPGEFTRRAFLNGKIGLTEAEAVMQLVSAQGAEAARAALAGRDGALTRKIAEARKRLVTIAAGLEVWADDPDEDVPQVDSLTLKISLGTVKRELDRLLSQFEAGRALREGIETVIAGRPNVGKSTLMNLLSGCERSIVTEYEGTTRDVVEETVLLGGVPLRLADTAGIRETSDPVEKIGVDRAFGRLRQAQLVLAVFDSSQLLTAEDKRLVEEVRGIPAIAVINKTDLCAKLDLRYIRTHFREVVYISALNGEGLHALEEAIGRLLELNRLDPAEGMLCTERQRDAARRAGECVEEALQAVNAHITLDAVTVSVEGAITALMELTGERASDAVVEEVFSKFCVGK